MEQAPKLAGATYKRLQDIVLDLRGVATNAKAYHKALQELSSTSGKLFSSIQNIGAKVSSLTGSVSALGECLEQIGSSYRTINAQLDNWVTSLESDFISPLETRLKTAPKEYENLLKTYKQDHYNKQVIVSKSHKKIVAYKKKKNMTSEDLAKESQLQQAHSTYVEERDTVRMQGLQQSLLEERKLYCFVIDQYCVVVRNEIAWNAVSHQVLSSKVIEWAGLASKPFILPPRDVAEVLGSTDSTSDIEDDGPPVARAGDDSDGEGRMPALPMDSSPPAEASDIQRKKTKVSYRTRAIFPHRATAVDRLEFNSGDLIDAVGEAEGGWQFGENIKTGKSGWFPADFVEKLWKPSPDAQRRRRQPGGGGGDSVHSGSIASLQASDWSRISPPQMA
ncbi:hypothetical protein EMCRGX_G027781 [Ephydatia muelleri]|eukprot:Em0020g827a